MNRAGQVRATTSSFRKKKKLLREQRKQRERVELKMDLPGVSIAEEGETGMFSLRTIRGHQVSWAQGCSECARGKAACPKSESSGFGCYLELQKSLGKATGGTL